MALGDMTASNSLLRHLAGAFGGKMASIPWKLKSLAFSIFDVIGQAPLYVAQKYLTRRSRPSFVKPSPAWIFHSGKLKEHAARRIIEFGAGKSLAQNFYLHVPDLEQVLVDLNPMLDLALVNEAIDRLAGLGVVGLDGRVTSMEDLRSKYGITYLAPVDMRRVDFEDESFDACISTNTLEHIPKDVITGIWKEVYRVLRPGGIVCAVIDYSDHYAHTDRSLSRLNYLTFTDAQWKRYNHACHYQNRLRHGQHLKLLANAGFEIVSARAELPVSPEGLAIRQENLAGDANDFHTAGYIVVRKP